MEIMNWQEITMESETFSKIRESFNLLLQRLFQKMEQNHSDEGAITLKVNLSISKDFIPDGNGSSREVHKPVALIWKNYWLITSLQMESEKQ